MDELVIRYPFLFTLIISFLACFLMKNCFIMHKTAKKNIPPPPSPSPPKLPIIGNLHQLCSLPHYTLRFLAQKHGSIMLPHFGSTPVLIVSSADAASECMKTHDMANRPKLEIVKRIFYNMKSLTTTAYGEYWKQLRSICAHQLLSTKKVHSFEVIRNEEISFLVKKSEESFLSLSPVNLSMLFSLLANNVICRSAFGRKYSESEVGMRFLLMVIIMPDIQKMLINFSIGEFIPWLAWINKLNGYDYRVKKLVKNIEVVLNEMIQEHLVAKDAIDRENLLDILLNIYQKNNAM